MLRLHGSADQLTLRFRRRTFSRPLLLALAAALALHLTALLLIDLRSPSLSQFPPRRPSSVSADPGLTIQASGTEATRLPGPSGLLPRHIPIPEVPHPELPHLPASNLTIGLPPISSQLPSFASAEAPIDLPDRALFPRTYSPITLELSHELAHLELVGAPPCETRATLEPLSQQLIHYRLLVDPCSGEILRAQPLDDNAPELDALLANLSFQPIDTFEPILSGLLEVCLTQ